MKNYYEPDLLQIDREIEKSENFKTFEEERDQCKTVDFRSEQLKYRATGTKSIFRKKKTATPY